MEKLANLEKFLLVKIDKLVPADWNYKKDEPEKIKKLVNNVKRNGQIENIIVRQLKTGFYEVVNGNHRLAVFKEIGLDKAVVYDLGKISLQEAKRIAIETNETKFEVDNIKLAENIKDILSQFTLPELIETMPYSQDELENMNKLLDFDWDNFEKTQEEKKESSKETYDGKVVTLKIPHGNFDAFMQRLDEILKKYPLIEKEIG